MALTTDQLRIAQAVYDVFREHGEWPIVDAIDRLADERWEIDAFDVLRSFPGRVGLVDRLHLRDDQAVKLQVRAIAACDNSHDDLQLFVRAVRWLAEKERSFRPTSMHAAQQVRVTSEQVSEDLAREGMAIDSVASAKVYSLAEIERLTWVARSGSTATPDGGRSTCAGTSVLSGVWRPSTTTWQSGIGSTMPRRPRPGRCPASRGSSGRSAA